MKNILWSFAMLYIGFAAQDIDINANELCTITKTSFGKYLYSTEVFILHYLCILGFSEYKDTFSASVTGDSLNYQLAKEDCV
jgi:hypothetical protein